MFSKSICGRRKRTVSAVVVIFRPDGMGTLGDNATAVSLSGLAGACAACAAAGEGGTAASAWTSNGLGLRSPAAIRSRRIRYRALSKVFAVMVKPCSCKVARSTARRTPAPIAASTSSNISRRRAVSDLLVSFDGSSRSASTRFALFIRLVPSVDVGLQRGAVRLQGVCSAFAVCVHESNRLCAMAVQWHRLMAR
jgi:hypothetical protein